MNFGIENTSLAIPKITSRAGCVYVYAVKVLIKNMVLPGPRVEIFL